MWKYIKPRLPFAVIAGLFMFGEVFMDLIQPGIMSQIVDDGVLGLNNGGVGNLSLIWKLGIQMIGLVLFGGLCGSLQLCMADAAGIATVPHALIKTGAGLAYITKRVDRVFEKEHVKMLAMEDFCRLDLRLTQDKYRGSYERCAKIIGKYSIRRGLVPDCQGGLRYLKIRNKAVLRLRDDYTIMALKNSNVPAGIKRQNF